MLYDMCNPMKCSVMSIQYQLSLIRTNDLTNKYTSTYSCPFKKKITNLRMSLLPNNHIVLFSSFSSKTRVLTVNNEWMY
ncbi:hypothetical protein KUTeg_020355 [Tegillarca granosa]|uniref:Uncharacterized protein n=1 Tax=Tegillarca granosa TaxID=220873 RepID=A0ABQ9E7L7_TEGGR|nr:hypothetical protein KUTeg_020355 [Tegillarca granosa]